MDTNDADSIKCAPNIDGAGESRTAQLRSYEFDAMVAATEAVTDDSTFL